MQKQELKQLRERDDMQKLDLKMYDTDSLNELRKYAVEKPTPQFKVPDSSDDLEKLEVSLLQEDQNSHTLITNVIPKCGKCIKGHNGLNYVMTNYETIEHTDKPNLKFKRSNTVKLCPNCGELNLKLARIERLKLPVEALGKTLNSFQMTDNPHLIDVLKRVFREELGLYLYGPYGVGKTHLIYGMARRLIWEQGKKVKLMNFHEHLASIKRAWDDKDHRSPEHDWLDKYDVVIIDEFGGGYEGGKKVTDWVRMTTSEMLMEAHKKQVQMILVTNIGEQHKHVLESLLERRVLNRLGQICPIKYQVQGRSRRPSFF